MLYITEYHDYREYLKDFFDKKQKKNHRYSYECMAQKCGIPKGFLYKIMNPEEYGRLKKTKKGFARRNTLSKIAGFKIARDVLMLTDYEIEYFDNMVAWTHAKEELEYCRLREYNQKEEYELCIVIQHYENIADKLKKENIRSPQSLINRREFYSHWYYHAIWAIIEGYPANDSHITLASKLNPNISAAQAKKSIKLLERLKLITKKDTGEWHIVDNDIKSSLKLDKEVLNELRLQFGRLALASIKKSDSQITSVTLGLSEQNLERINKEIVEFKHKIIKLANDSKNIDRAYQFHLVLFPLTKDIQKR